METNLFRYIWRHSWRDQLVIFAVVIGSLPFYFMSLELPKRIVNEAIQGNAFRDGATEVLAFRFDLSLPAFLGGGSWRVFEGVNLAQMGLLFALSGVFLLLVLINGAFKYWINVAKGALGERMLRRLRFDLVAQLFRFTPNTLRSVKSSEVATMVKDEVEPVGGFIGDAFVLPLFVGTQAATAMTFILLQNVWLGLLAGAVVALQLIVIPRLRREQLRLGKERQLASRKFAGRVGEIVEGMQAIRVHGAERWEHADIGYRLHTLFDIRFRLYKRKFLVKYLNNLLAQITPFFFYSIGGYFALTGRLDIGQLVAVIGAYRELPPPLKELIDWDQQRLDVQIKYDQVVQQFSPDELLPLAAGVTAATDATPVSDVELLVEDLSLANPEGGHVLSGVGFKTSLPAHICLYGEGDAPGALAQMLAGLVRPTSGMLRVGEQDFAQLPPAMLRDEIAYAGPDAILFPGTLRESLLYGLRKPPELGKAETPDETRRRIEAKRTGNPVDDPRLDWIDYDKLGTQGALDLDRSLLSALQAVGMRKDAYRLGLAGRMPSDLDDAVQVQIIEARRALRSALTDAGGRQLVEPFDPQSYNGQATLIENILFGVARQGGTPERFLDDPVFRRALEETQLDKEFQRLGVAIAETMTEIFRDLPPGHSLFSQFSFIDADDLDEYADILRRRGMKGRNALTAADRRMLMRLPLEYIEPRHRLGLLDDALRARAIEARARFRALSGDNGMVEFYDPDCVCTAAPMRDNLLFGRVAYGASNAEGTVVEALTRVVDEMGLREVVERVGLSSEVGPAGRLLTPQQRARVSLARCIVKRPSWLVLDRGLSVLGDVEEARVLADLVDLMEGRTLISASRVAPEGVPFDVILQFEGAQATQIQDKEARTMGARTSIPAQEKAAS